VVLDV
jgi:hypothetical protein